MKSNVGLDICYKVVWVGHFVDVVVLSETQCNINYLKKFQCVITLNVFVVLCVCLEKLKMHFVLATNLHVSTC
jgi:uncharacterized protein (DUF486 family)